MPYRSDITVDDSLLKDAVFSVSDDSLLIEHAALSALYIQPGKVFLLGIVGLMMYRDVTLLAIDGNKMLLDLWAVTRTKQQEKRAGWKKRGPRSK